MASLSLPLLENYPFRLGRRDVRIWSPNPLDGFSSVLSRPCWILLLVSRFVQFFGESRFLERLDSFLGRCSMVVVSSLIGSPGFCLI